MKSLRHRSFPSMQQGKMFFVMGLCMALVQGGYVRRIPHGKEITAAITVGEVVPSRYVLTCSIVKCSCIMDKQQSYTFVRALFCLL